MLDAIMGKSDATMMKEKMAYAMDDKMPVDKRIEALDDFEMVSCAHHQDVREKADGSDDRAHR